MATTKEAVLLETLDDLLARVPIYM